jgi:hypothetical protein
MMKMSFKQMFIGSLKSTKTAVYTVPSTNTQTVVRDLTIYNSDTTNTVSVKMYVNDTLLVNQTVSPTDTLFGQKDWHLVLNPNDKIYFETSKDDAIQVILSGAETVEVADE